MILIWILRNVLRQGYAEYSPQARSILSTDCIQLAAAPPALCMELSPDAPTLDSQCFIPNLHPPTAPPQPLLTCTASQHCSCCYPGSAYPTLTSSSSPCLCCAALGSRQHVEAAVTMRTWARHHTQSQMASAPLCEAPVSSHIPPTRALGSMRIHLWSAKWVDGGQELEPCKLGQK